MPAQPIEIFTHPLKLLITPETKLVPNITLKEFFCTSQDNPLKAFQFSEKLWSEFAALPAERRAKIYWSLCQLAQRIEVIRDFYNAPVTIHSGWRSFRLNALVGGKSTSTHLLGLAADIAVAGVPLERLYKDFKNWFGGLALGPGFVHVDIRTNKARWTY